MEINVYDEFLSRPEIEFLTGCKQESPIIKPLNAQGIKFTLNAAGYPVVRRDYANTKTKSNKAGAEKETWSPKVLYA